MRKTTISSEFRRAGILPHTFAFERALKLGFVCANAARQGHDGGLLVIDDLDSMLALLKLQRGDLVTRNKSELAAVKAALQLHGEEVPLWFSIGFWCFSATWTLATAGNQKELVSGAEIDTEGMRILLKEDAHVRSVCSNFIASLTDAKWSPDEAERFTTEKIFPFAWDGGHQKWVFNIEMAVMQDLSFIAREKDKPLRDFERPRIYGAIRALIEGIPIVGKAIAILIFGKT